MANEEVSIDVKVTSNKAEYERAFDEAADAILSMLGMEVETAAKKLCPVDTGLLRNSITYALAGETAAIPAYTADLGGKSGTYAGKSPEMTVDGVRAVHIGSNVEYALAQETGDFKNGPHAFLRPAVNNNTARFKQIIQEELSKALKGD